MTKSLTKSLTNHHRSPDQSLSLTAIQLPNHLLLKATIPNLIRSPSLGLRNNIHTLLTHLGLLSICHRVRARPTRQTTNPTLPMPLTPSRLGRLVRIINPPTPLTPPHPNLPTRTTKTSRWPVLIRHPKPLMWLRQSLHLMTHMGLLS